MTKRLRKKQMTRTNINTHITSLKHVININGHKGAAKSLLHKFQHHAGKPR